MMIFRIVDFPDAARAEDDLRVPRDQREADVPEDHFVVERELHVIEHDTGAPGSLRISSAVGSRGSRVGTCIARSVQQRDQHLGHEEIDRDHRHRSGDHGDGGRLADALRAAAGPQADVAGDRDDRRSRGRTA